MVIDRISNNYRALLAKILLVKSLNTTSKSDLIAEVLRLYDIVKVQNPPKNTDAVTPFPA